MSAKLSVITGSILLLSAPLQGFSATTHPDSCMNRDWKKRFPFRCIQTGKWWIFIIRHGKLRQAASEKGRKAFPRLPIWMRIAMKIKYGYGIPVSWCFCQVCA